MKLQEILRVGQHKGKRYQVGSFDLKDKELMGHTEGKLRVYKAQAIDDKNTILYGLFDQHHTLLSSVMGVFFTLNGVVYFALKDAFTPPPLQKQGYATSLYVFLIKDLHLKLLSDVEQTPRGEDLWRSIRRVIPVKIYDSNTKKILPPNSISDNEIYTVDESKNRYLFIAENWLSESMLDIQKKTFIPGNILDRYIVYTQPENHGKYD